MKRSLLAFAAFVLAALLFAQATAARNPGGRDFRGAIFSAGVSGKDGPNNPTLKAPTTLLGSLVRASDDSGVAIPLLPEELTTSGRVFFDSQTEPWVTVNPGNTSNVVGMFQEERWSTGGARNLVLATSFNGGKSWQNIPVRGVGIVAGGEFQRVTDPWVDFGPNNRVYATSLGFDDTGPDNAIVVQASTDGGKSWGAPVTVIKDTQFQFFNDKQALVADDSASSPSEGNVYVTWDRLIDKSGNPFEGNFTGPAMFSRSTDGGQTFSPPRVIFDTGTNEQTIGNVPVVLRDGTLVVGGTFFENGGTEKQQTFFYVVRSTDGGQTFSAPFIVAEEKPVLVRDVRSGDTVPILAVDPKTDRIYATWEDSRFSGGKRDDILVIHSDDGGLTWSQPAKANDTPPGAQDAFTPTVAVDANGRVGILYYDLRDDARFNDDSILTTEWITFSTDGGQTWSASQRLTPTFDQTASPFAGGFFLGDYQGLTAAGAVFQPFFAADLLNQANGFLGSDIFSTRVK